MNLFRGKLYYQDEIFYLKIDENKVMLNDHLGKELLKKGHIGEDIFAGVRPEDIQLVENGPLQAVVEVYELLGSESYLYFTFQGEKMCMKVDADIPVKVGDRISFTLLHEKIHFFDVYHGNRV